MEIRASRRILTTTGSSILALISCVFIVGCDSGSAEVESASANSGSITAQRFEWPVDPDTGHVRQVTKKLTDRDLQPSLVLMSSLPGGQIPDRDITPLGVHRVSTEELEEKFKVGNWALVDVRKDADIQSKGTIPGAYHSEYKFEAAHYKGTTRLTQEIVQRLLKQYDGVVFFCNGPKCARSFNACVAAAQFWGIPSNRIRWFRNGVPAWRKTALIPMSRELPTGTI